jgi:elongator complex protein 3
MPKSYLSDEPAAQRAKQLNFDPAAQVKMRLAQLKNTGHVRDKIEIIVIGGTFSAYPDEYREQFIKAIFDTCNHSVSQTLNEAQEKNETAKHRIVGLSVETRPDWITEKEIKLYRQWGVTKVQVGVQALDEKILTRIRRGHGLAAVASATQLLRDAGFKICYHFMPNLPGSTPAKDIAMAKQMYKDERFKPDYVKLYPCMVIPTTALHQEWKDGEYRPYPDHILRDTLKEITALTPEWVRIDRLVRDISKKWVSAGTVRTNMRQEVEEDLRREGRPCRCIRCREVKGSYQSHPRLKVKTYRTQGGREYFLTFEESDLLCSLLRLRLPEANNLFTELNGAAIIREVHTFGSALAVASHKAKKTQHQGLGTRLVAKAEAIAKKNGYKKIAVISAVGTRDYYRKFGFEVDGLYMTKKIE